MTAGGVDKYTELRSAIAAVADDRFSLAFDAGIKALPGANVIRDGDEVTIAYNGKTTSGNRRRHRRHLQRFLREEWLPAARVHLATANGGRVKRGTRVHGTLVKDDEVHGCARCGKETSWQFCDRCVDWRADLTEILAEEPSLLHKPLSLRVRLAKRIAPNAVTATGFWKEMSLRGINAEEYGRYGSGDAIESAHAAQDGW